VLDHPVFVGDHPEPSPDGFEQFFPVTDFREEPKGRRSVPAFLLTAHKPKS